MWLSPSLIPHSKERSGHSSGAVQAVFPPCYFTPFLYYPLIAGVGLWWVSSCAQGLRAVLQKWTRPFHTSLNRLSTQGRADLLLNRLFFS